jgi:hypothetical protein
MDGPEGWRAEVEVTIGDRTVGPFLFPPDASVTFGRASQCGLRVDDERAPRVIAQFRPTEFGWILLNGDRTRVHARSLYVPAASLDRRAHFLLQPGADWTLTWDLDVRLTASIRYRKDAHGEPLPVLRDRPAEAAEQPLLLRCAGHIVEVDRVRGTDLAGDHLKLTRAQRRSLGALFAWIIEGEPRPDNMVTAAVSRSGATIPQIAGVWTKVMVYVNRHRDHDAQITSLEELGYHLVEVVGVIGPDDIPERPAYSSTHRTRA